MSTLFHRVITVTPSDLTEAFPWFEDDQDADVEGCATPFVPGTYGRRNNPHGEPSEPALVEGLLVMIGQKDVTDLLTRQARKRIEASIFDGLDGRDDE